MDGVQEAVATKVRVFRKNGSTLTFGVYNGRFDAVMDGDDAPLLTLQTGRNIGQSGSAVFAIPGLSKHEVGPHWVELISLGDFVEIESTVQRAPGSQKNADGYSHKWRGIFTGRVADIEEEDVPDGDGFALITTIICEDFLGTLDTPQFSYWRKLGATFGAQGNLREKLERLDRLDLGEKEITANSIAVSAQILLESFIEGRIDIRRKIDGKDRDQKDTYGYRFESDDLRMGNLSLETLAPEGQSWKAAFEEVVDGPVFYEMFQDSLPGGSSKTLSPIKEGKSDGVARGRPGPESRRTRALEASVSTSSSGLRHFPRTGDEIDGDTNTTGRTFFSQAAWNALPIIEAAPFAHGNLRLSKTRRHLKSVFSVNIAARGFQNQSVTAEADTNGQLVGDIHKLISETGYDPLDLPTKRTPDRTSGTSLSSPQLSRTLAWQALSFNQLNDLYLNGTSNIPVDLRLQLGHRWREADYLFYIEGYKHIFTPDTATSQVSLSRGLMVEAYGYEPKGRPKVGDMMDYVKKYLGRQRPGEEGTPTAGQGIMSELNTAPEGGG